MTEAALVGADREQLVELAPVLRRAVSMDAAALVRLRLGAGRSVALVRLPFDVLVSRSVQSARNDLVDVVVRVDEALNWLDGDPSELPQVRDAQWRSGLPPATGWTRLDGVPDDVIRPLVRRGATTLAEAAEREGVPGAQPRAEVTDSLLDSVVLRVEQRVDGRDVIAEVTLRALSALLRMGFLPRDGQAYVDTAGRWIRVVAQYGTVYLERRGSGLTVL